MCGITGLLHPDAKNLVHAFSSLVSHRGPDNQGIYCDGQLALAHRHLSIQDTSSNGHQPMCSADGCYVITFNGDPSRVTKEMGQCLRRAGRTPL